MDKRFFLALFLSLIVIAVSQLLFPPVRPKTPAKTSTASDSATALATSASTTAAVIAQPASPSPAQPGAIRNSGVDTSVTPAMQTAESTTVTTPKAVFR